MASLIDFTWIDAVCTTWQIAAVANRRVRQSDIIGSVIGLPVYVMSFVYMLAYWPNFDLTVLRPVFLQSSFTALMQRQFVMYMLQMLVLDGLVKFKPSLICHHVGCLIIVAMVSGTKYFYLGMMAESTNLWLAMYGIAKYTGRYEMTTGVVFTCAFVLIRLCYITPLYIHDVLFAPHGHGRAYYGSLVVVAILLPLHIMWSIEIARMLYRRISHKQTKP